MSRAEQLIYQRRAQEQKLSNMQTKLKQEFHQKEFAVWQNKGKNLEIQNQVKARMNQARAESHANLIQRRYLPPYADRDWLPCFTKTIRSTRKKSSTARKPPNRSGRRWQRECKSSKLRRSQGECRR